MSTSIEACEKKISKKVFELMKAQFQAGGVIEDSLSLFEAVSPVSSFGSATYPTLHEAVAIFSQSLIWSWGGGSTNYAGAPEGSHEFVMECLAVSQLASEIEAEAHLTNEFLATRRRHPGAEEIEQAHRTLRLIAWLCHECMVLARNAFPEKELEAKGWKRMGRKEAAKALGICQNTLDNWKNKNHDVVRHIRVGLYLVNPAHIKKHD